jgi:hypothetical protein
MSGAAKNGEAPTLGDLVEQWADNRFPWDYHDEWYYDFEGLRDKPIQVKGTQPWIKNGYDDRGNRKYCRGRFKFWRGDHSKLDDHDGVYLLVIYDEVHGGDAIRVVAWKIIGTSALEDAVGGDWWDVNSNGRTASKGDIYRTSWATFFDDSEVDDG